MPAQLFSLDDGPSILLDKPILLLGRHPECDIQIDSRKISRRHCCVAQVNDYFVVRDLGSTNGVRINGVRVLEGKLADGDELTIGTSRYQVTWEADEANGQPRRQLPLQPSAAPDPVEDDLLESSDEPVALPDPGAAVNARRGPNFGQPRPTKVDKSCDEPQRPTPKPDPLLPEDLDLLPLSHVNLSPTATPPPAESNPT